MGDRPGTGTKACQLQTKQIQNTFFHKYNERQVKIHAKLVFGKNWKRDSLGGCNNLHKFPEENYACNNSGFLKQNRNMLMSLSMLAQDQNKICFATVHKCHKTHPTLFWVSQHEGGVVPPVGRKSRLWPLNLDIGPISPWGNMRAIERSKKEKQMGFKQL